MCKNVMFLTVFLMMPFFHSFCGDSTVAPHPPYREAGGDMKTFMEPFTTKEFMVTETTPTTIEAVVQSWARDANALGNKTAAEAARKPGRLVRCYPIRLLQPSGEEYTAEKELINAIADTVTTTARLGIRGSLRVIGGVLVGLLYSTEIGQDIEPADRNGCCPEGYLPFVEEMVDGEWTMQFFEEN